MSLPIIQCPTYILEIPSTKQKVKFRGFLVKEEKMLLLTITDNNADTVSTNLKQIIKNCTFGAIDVDKLSSFDCEFIFLQIRSKSKGNLIQLQYTCKNTILEVAASDISMKDKPCDTKNEFQIDLDNAKVFFNPENHKKIIIKDEVGIMMKYPTLDTIIEIQQSFNTGDVNSIYANIPNFVECVFKGDQIWDKFTKEEFSEWLENLTNEQFSKIEQFFDTLPQVQLTTKVTCKKCAHEEEIVLSGLQSFFESA
jgi:2'-5' RNA ligase